MSHTPQMCKIVVNSTVVYAVQFFFRTYSADSLMEYVLVLLM